MLHSRRHLFTLAVGLCSLSFAAQEAPVPRERELRLLAWSPVNLSLTLGDSEKAPALVLSTDQFNLIKGKKIPSGKMLDIFVDVPDPKGEAAKGPPPAATKVIPGALPGEGQGPAGAASTASVGPTHKVLYASAAWPENSRCAIGFIIPEGEGIRPKGKLVLLPDSPELHPEHAMRAINLTIVPLAVRLGEKNAVLPPGGELISPFDPGRLRIDIAVSDNSTWKPVAGTNLATARHYRCFALIRPQVNPNPEFPSEAPDIQGVFEQTSPLPVRLPLPTPPAASPQ